MPGPGRARRLYGRFPITSPEPGRPTGCRRGGSPARRVDPLSVRLLAPPMGGSARLRDVVGL